jgi:hypothetical protein
MGRARNNQQASRPAAPVEPETEPVPAEPVEPEQEPTPAEPVDAATAEQTSDYTRRAGGYVLTDRGWVLDEQK